MRKKIKRHILVPAVLLIYTAVMGVYAYPAYREKENWNEFFLIIGIGILLPVLLFFVLRRRQKVRDEFTKID